MIYGWYTTNINGLPNRTLGFVEAKSEEEAEEKTNVVAKRENIYEYTIVTPLSEYAYDTVEENNKLAIASIENEIQYLQEELENYKRRISLLK